MYGGTKESKMKKHGEMTRRQQRIAAVIISLVVIIIISFICIYIGIPLMKFITEPERFRAWVENHGILGRAIYVLIVLLQVAIAIVPGEPLEIAAGYAFGVLEGSLLYMIGAMIGSILVFYLVRHYGIRFLEIFFSSDKLQSLQFLKNNRKRSVLLFIIFLIPGTPKDLLCYYAGLTDMKLSTFLIINAVGRLPALLTSVVGGNALGVQSYTAAIVVFGITLLFSVIGYFIYQRISSKRE